MAIGKLDQQMISRKIIQLRGEGFKRDQATAIAFRMYRDGEMPRATKKVKTPARLRKSSKRTRRYRKR